MKVIEEATIEFFEYRTFPAVVTVKVAFTSYGEANAFFDLARSNIGRTFDHLNEKIEGGVE